MIWAILICRGEAVFFNPNFVFQTLRLIWFCNFGIFCHQLFWLTVMVLKPNKFKEKGLKYRFINRFLLDIPEFLNAEQSLCSAGLELRQVINERSSKLWRASRTQIPKHLGQKYPEKQIRRKKNTNTNQSRYCDRALCCNRQTLTTCRWISIGNS